MAPALQSVEVANWTQNQQERNQRHWVPQRRQTSPYFQRFPRSSSTSLQRGLGACTSQNAISSPRNLQLKRSREAGEKHGPRTAHSVITRDKMQVSHFRAHALFVLQWASPREAPFFRARPCT